MSTASIKGSDLVLGTRKAALVLVSLGAFALAGCGPATGSSQGERKSDTLTLLRSDAKGSVQKSADTTSKATSVTIVMNGTSDGKPIKGHGAVALGGPLKAEIVMEEAATGQTTVRMLGTAIYVQIPTKDRASMDGKSWMKMDLAGKDKAAGEIARQLDNMDPSKQVKTLIASGSVTVVGEDTVGGVKTVHYAATAPIAAYLGQLDPTMRPQVEKVLTDKGIKEAKVDLWVDEQYTLRRSRSVLGTATDITVDYIDYNKPVTVTAPPAADTFDLAEMMNKLKSGITG
ncbi:MAG TPA: hypothetical protein VGP31_10170 [Planosporangium sp.]|nr:hypothetical protein [Planosporangium sp.]